MDDSWRANGRDARRRWALVLCVAVLGVTSGLAVGSGGSRPGNVAGAANATSGVSADGLAGSAGSSSDQVVTLVPEPAGTASGCVLASLSDPYPESTVGYLAFQGNLFALPSGSVGETELCYHAHSGTLTDRTTFASLPDATQHDVLGYPEAILGENIYGGEAGATNPSLPLPFDTFGNLTHHDAWVTLDYSVEAPGDSPFDFAFDDWFSVDRATSSSTGDVGDRIELMIWFANDIGMYLPQTKVSIPSYLNGSAAPGTWFRDDLCMGSQDITFDYLYAPSGSTPGHGERSGTIAVNLTAILDNVASVIRGGACWASAGTSVSSFYADNFPLGAEFYPTENDVASVDWRVSGLCYTLVAGKATDRKVDCGSSASDVSFDSFVGGPPSSVPAAPSAPRAPLPPGGRTWPGTLRDLARASGAESLPGPFGTNSFVPERLSA